MSICENLRARNNEKVNRFIGDVLENCILEEFSIADMKDLVTILPGEVDKAVISVEENTRFSKTF